MMKIKNEEKWDFNLLNIKGVLAMIFGVESLENLLNKKILYSGTLCCYLRLNIIANKVEFKRKIKY